MLCYVSNPKKRERWTSLLVVLIVALLFGVRRGRGGDEIDENGDRLALVELAQVAHHLLFGSDEAAVRRVVVVAGGDVDELDFSGEVVHHNHVVRLVIAHVGRHQGIGVQLVLRQFAHGASLVDGNIRPVLDWKPIETPWKQNRRLKDTKTK